MPNTGMPVGNLMLGNLVTALTTLMTKHPELFRTIYLMVTGLLKADNPWRFAMRTFLAEAAKHAGQELADELIQARHSMKEPGR